MKSLKGKLKKKLCSQSGESIGETLVALLISTLALVMLAGAMASASGVITKSRDKLDSYYDAAENVVTRTSAAQELNGKKITITDSRGAIGPRSFDNISYYLDSVLSDTPVIAYEKNDVASGLP